MKIITTDKKAKESLDFHRAEAQARGLCHWPIWIMKRATGKEPCRWHVWGLMQRGKMVPVDAICFEDLPHFKGIALHYYLPDGIYSVQGTKLRIKNGTRWIK